MRIECRTVEDEVHVLGPYQRVELNVERGEVFCDGAQVISVGDMFAYCDAVQYHDGTLQAITSITVVP